MNTGFMCYIHNANVIRGTICSLYIDNAWYSNLSSRSIQLEFDIINIPMRYLAFAISSNNYSWEVLHVQDKQNNTIANVTIPENYNGTVKLGVKLYDTPPTVGSILNVGFDYVITGGIDLSTRNVTKTITLSCATEGAKIYYTLDDTDPTEQSTEYAGAFAIEHNCTIKAKAYKDDMVTSALSELFVIVEVVVNPVISEGVNGHGITITTETPDADIYYTTDGSEPTVETGILYTGAFDVHETCTIKAKGFKENWEPSEVVSKEIVVKLPTPEISLTQSETSASIVLANSSDYEHYEDVLFEIRIGDSTDWETIGTFSTAYNLDGNYTYHVRATNDGICSDSDEASVTVTTLKCQVSLSLDDWETYVTRINVNITPVHAVAYYTTDGTDPTEEDNVVVVSITGSQSMTVKVRAYKEGWIPSDIVTGTYEQVNMPDISYNPDTRTLTITKEEDTTITCSVTDNHIDYESSVYESPIVIADDTLQMIINVGKEGYLANGMYLVVPPEPVISILGGTDYRMVRVTFNADEYYESIILQYGKLVYTTDGSEPDENSTEIQPNQSFIVNENCTVKVKYIGESFIMADFYKWLTLDSSTVSKEIVITQTSDVLGYGEDTIGYNGDEIGY